MGQDMIFPLPPWFGSIKLSEGPVRLGIVVIPVVACGMRGVWACPQQERTCKSFALDVLLVSGPFVYHGR